jgi:hypothetical protein
MDATKTPIPILEGHDCFACGTNNPIGLKLPVAPTIPLASNWTFTARVTLSAQM